MDLRDTENCARYQAFIYTKLATVFVYTIMMLKYGILIANFK